MERDGLSVVPEATPPLEPTPPHGRGTFRALGSRNFRLYFAGQVVSASGTFLQATAIGWLVFQLTHSAASLGLVLATAGVPSLLLGPWGGAIADRFDLRRLLIVTQIMLGALAAALWVVVATGSASVGVIVTIGVSAGVVGIVDSPARQAFVAALVPAEDLSSAISLNGVVVNSARVVGPAVAGALIVTVGTTPCFAINAVSYLAVIGALLGLRSTGGTGRPLATPSGVRAGVRYARSRQQLWLPLTMMALVGLLAFNFSVILPVLAENTFHGGGGTYSLLTTALGVGSVAGSFAVGFVHHPRRRYLVSGAFAFGVGLAVTAFAPGVAAACVTLTLTGFAAFCFTTMASTTVQLHSADAYRGRIMALWVFVFIGTTPVGSVITGAVSAAGGPRAALLMGAASCLLAAALAARVPTPAHPDQAFTDLRGR